MSRFDKNVGYTVSGIAGAVILLFGLFQTESQLWYVIGSLLLLITAINFQLLYFIALELILIAGHSVIYLGIGSTLQIALPALLCVQLLFYYWSSNQLNNIYLLIGIVGIAALSVGFSYENAWVFLTGSLSIAVYSWYISKRIRIALIWAVLNTAFSFVMAFRIIMPSFH